MNKTNFKKITALGLSAVLTLSLAACGAANSQMEQYYPAEDNYYGTMDMAVSNSAGLGGILNSFDSSMKSEAIYDAEYAPESPVVEETINTDSSTATKDYLASQKLIYSARFEIESLEFEKAQQNINALIEQYEGFIASNSVRDSSRNWYVSDYTKTNGTLTQELTVRVPSEHYNEFVNGMASIGKVMRKTENVQNITTQYNDTATTIESLKIQETRLLEMMASCYSIDDMISVERRLSEVQSELEMYKTQLNRYDADVQFSTVTIILSEVREYSPTYEEKNFFERLYDHIDDVVHDFGYFLEDLLYFIIALVPYAALVIVIAIPIRKAIRKRKDRKRLTKTMEEFAQNNPIVTPEQGIQSDEAIQTAIGSKKDNKKSNNK